MLVFGPYRAIPKYETFKIFNLSSLNESVPKLPGLFVIPDNFAASAWTDKEMFEKQFDIWYYEYVTTDPIACNSLMQVLYSLYNGDKVYICIDNDESNYVINALNESFMKLIQTRYDIKYSIINEPFDYEFIPKDGCDFGSVAGINTFDDDRKRYMQLSEEQRILNGGAIFNET